MFVHKVEFVGQARCCPGFPVSKEQAARPVPLSHQPYLSGKKLSLSASAQPPNWNMRRHILYIRACAMEEQRHGGNVLADKVHTSCVQCHHTTHPSSSSNTQTLSAGVPCISLPANWLSPMLLNRHKQHAPLRVPPTSVPVLCERMPDPLLNLHQAVSASISQ